ncbi:OLC1v1012179C4 [Oldenlandia corymbosa var. corymbosa]|uniref:OLC1v1012179C4 n=1 Tax=Oldenlandia corymbosa var. corymbosa TaxID=529605 RepID=A0AAV1DYX3_OLDCO|nr:OLC1v1012179C4 [Oldenlandia corymbosa var. corymbosa]
MFLLLSCRLRICEGFVSSENLNEIMFQHNTMMHIFHIAELRKWDENFKSLRFPIIDKPCSLQYLDLKPSLLVCVSHFPVLAEQTLLSYNLKCLFFLLNLARYCMRIFTYEYPEIWYCDDCKRANEKLSSSSGAKEGFLVESTEDTRKILHGHSTQPKKLPNDSRMIGMDRKKKFIPGKTKPLSAEEVIRLSSGALNHVSPVKVVHSRSVPRKNSSTLCKNIPVRCRDVPPKFPNQLIKATVSSAPAPSRHIKPNVAHHIPQSIKAVTNVNEVCRRDLEQKKDGRSQATLKEHTQNSKDVLWAPINEPSMDAERSTAEIRLEEGKCELKISSEPDVPRQQIVRSGNAALSNSEPWRTTSSVNHFCDPSLDAAWNGSFKVSNASKSWEISDKVQAHPRSRVRKKVYELSMMMPEALQFELVPRSDLWGDLSQYLFLDRRDIGLYFFPANMQRWEQYVTLREHMEAEDLAMRTRVEDMELLVFTSKLFRKDCQRWAGRRYLWGVFKKAKHASQVSTDEWHSEMDSNEVVDMDVDMIGGEDIGRL